MTRPEGMTDMCLLKLVATIAVIGLLFLSVFLKERKHRQERKDLVGPTSPGQ